MCEKYQPMYDEELSKLISEARELFGKLKQQAEVNEKQIALYQDLLDKRINHMEKTLSVFRNIAITFFITVIVPFVIGGFTIKNTVDNLVDADFATKQELLMSLGEVVDRQTDALDRAGHVDEAKAFNEKTKEGLLRIFNYKSRSVKE